MEAKKSQQFEASLDRKEVPNPFGKAGKEKAAKKVNMGIAGQTPKKLFAPALNSVGTAKHLTPNKYSESTEEADGDYFSPDRDTRFTSSAPVRPKTSRGTSHPSPDEFFNYVVPSPSHSFEPHTLIINDNSAPEDGDSDEQPTLQNDTYMLGMNLEGVSRERKVTLLACWLFGSAMRV